MAPKCYDGSELQQVQKNTDSFSLPKLQSIKSVVLAGNKVLLDGPGGPESYFFVARCT